MKFRSKSILASLFFATLLVLSSLLLKGKEAGYWVVGSIYMSWVWFFYSGSSKKACSARSSKSA